MQMLMDNWHEIKSFASTEKEERFLRGAVMNRNVWLYAEDRMLLVFVLVSDQLFQLHVFVNDQELRGKEAAKLGFGLIDEFRRCHSVSLLAQVERSNKRLRLFFSHILKMQSVFKDTRWCYYLKEVK